MRKPQFQTAIPKKRYQYGEYLITFLDDIVTSEKPAYQYVAAVSLEANPQPGLYLLCEPNVPTEEHTAQFALRLLMQDGEKIIAYSDAWGDFNVFATDALNFLRQILNLADEQYFEIR